MPLFDHPGLISRRLNSCMCWDRRGLARNNRAKQNAVQVFTKPLLLEIQVQMPDDSVAVKNSGAASPSSACGSIWMTLEQQKNSLATKIYLRDALKAEYRRVFHRYGAPPRTHPGMVRFTSCPVPARDCHFDARGRSAPCLPDACALSGCCVTVLPKNTRNTPCSYQRVYRCPV